VGDLRPARRLLSPSETLIFASTTEERVVIAKPKGRDEMSDDERATWAKFDSEIRKGFDDIDAGRVMDAGGL